MQVTSRATAVRDGRHRVGPLVRCSGHAKGMAQEWSFRVVLGSPRPGSGGSARGETSRIRGGRARGSGGGAGNHRVAADDADARHVEVRQLLSDPLRRKLVGGLRLFAVVEQADRHDHVIAGIDGVVGDESRFLRQRLGEVAVDPAHDGVDRARSDAVGAQAGIHSRCPLDRAEGIHATPEAWGPQEAVCPSRLRRARSASAGSLTAGPLERTYAHDAR